MIGMAFFTSTRGMVNEKSVSDSWLTFWMIMSTRMLAFAIGPNSRAAIPGLSGTPTRVIFAWLRSPVIPETATASISASSRVTSVPFPSLKLELTSSGTLYFAANSTDRLCNTLAPRLAISSISSYAILSIRLAVGTILGSVV